MESVRKRIKLKRRACSKKESSYNEQQGKTKGYLKQTSARQKLSEWRRAGEYIRVIETGRFTQNKTYGIRRSISHQCEFRTNRINNIIRDNKHKNK